ncbi:MULTISPECIES: ABC transporter substrate-binding protein [unclassified Clostridium]|uniref:siderophore ABC transporter substrate-binding protein n=1 Tax=unclassified Clostridium TaxID=2614128 RepID=UPI00189B51E4|nr:MULTISPECIES: ABC transporter substrate-binding protein [unclassified Clostridium]MCR1952451.1 ABC transporter substrate-binding protein [Clostridium sp. DSM 100503]
MKKRLAVILSMVMLLMVGVVGCTSGDKKAEESAQEENKTVVVTDQKGEVEVPVNPKNVVVLDYGSLDIMAKLGVEPVALPKSSLPTYLDKYKDDKYVDLGSLKEFDLEKINAAEPDLIIIEGRQESYYEDLKKIAPVLYLGTVNSDIFASAENNAKVLGKVFNKEEGVTAELESINKRLEAVSGKVKENNSTALMTMFNEGSLSVYGAGSRYDMVYSKFGFTPADTKIEVSNHGQNISFEYLKEKNPDYLFVLDRGAVTGTQASVKEAVENELIKTTKAYEEGHIVYVNPQAWYVGGSGIMAIDAIISDMETAVGIK